MSLMEEKHIQNFSHVIPLNDITHTLTVWRHAYWFLALYTDFIGRVDNVSPILSYSEEVKHLETWQSET